MRYIIVDKESGAVVGNLGGYTTKKAALKGRLSWPESAKGYHYVRNVLKCPPGEVFRANLYQWADDHYDIVEVSDISWKSPSGDVYTQKL